MIPLLEMYSFLHTVSIIDLKLHFLVSFITDACPGGGGGGNFNRRVTGVCHFTSEIAP